MATKSREVLRYTINGIVATAMHYSVLYTFLELLHVKPAGLANLGASIGGICFSFVGNRYFVFKHPTTPWLNQATRFAGLYSLVALLHGAILYFWTDVFNFNYKLGFLIAVIIQFSLGYLGSRKFVFQSTKTESIQSNTIK